MGDGSPGRGKALTLMACGVVLVGVVVGVRAKDLMGGGKHGGGTRPPARAAAAEPEDEGPGSSRLIEPRPTFPLEEFLINLADQDEIRFAKMTLELEIEDEAQKEILTKLKPQIRDAVIRTTSRRTLASLITAGGKDRLKKELKRDINEVLGASVVKQVYLTALAMQ